MNYIAGLFKSSATSSTSIDEDHHEEPIYTFQDQANPKALIIFFHDILWGGNDQQLHKSTWMSSSEPSVIWPETWLSTTYPEAQILSTHYDSGIWKGKIAGHMDLDKLRENLRHDILPIYKIGCPVFLVGHGLGGLVIKALIQEMQLKRDALAGSGSTSMESKDGEDLCKLESFLKNVKGILYYDTPFLGSKLVESMTLPRTSSLLDPLKVLCPDVSRLNEWFSTWRRSRNCATRMILAGRPTQVGCWYGHLVEEASARYDIDAMYTVSRSNHFSVSKPQDMIDTRFRWLVELIDPVMLATPLTTSPATSPYDMPKEKKPMHVAPIEDKTKRLRAEPDKDSVKEMEARPSPDQDDLEDLCTDPITMDIMCDPVKCSDGRTYCRWTIVDNGIRISPYDRNMKLVISCDDITIRSILFKLFPEQASKFRFRRSKHREEALRHARAHPVQLEDAIEKLNNVLQWSPRDPECQNERAKVIDLLEQQPYYNPGNNARRRGRSWH